MVVINPAGLGTGIRHLLLDLGQIIIVSDVSDLVLDVFGLKLPKFLDVVGASAPTPTDGRP